jgi:hypothetical protein
LYRHAIRWFSGRARWLDLGGGAGAVSDPSDGLCRFKRGWSTGVRPTYFCGRVFDQGRYAKLLRRRAATAFFPAYRAGDAA